MARTTPSFFRRLGLAFSVLFNAERAARLQDVPEHDEQASAIAAEPAAAAPAPVIVRETTPEAALRVLDAFAARNTEIRPAVFDYLERKRRAARPRPAHAQPNRPS